MPMSFGFMLQPRDLEETAVLARDAEALGYKWLGVADSPVVYQDAFLHQLQALRATERLRVGPLVTHVVARHPLIVGNMLATLNETSDGRVRAAVGTGNSAARGLGLRPETVRGLEEGIVCIRGYWRGEGGTFRDSSVPVTGLVREGCELLVAGDGPRVSEMAGRCGDGFLYGASMRDDVLRRRVGAGRTDPGQKVWMGPAVSLAETRAGVLEDMGPQIIAMANRALRGDLHERGVPAELHDDVHELWRRYDYAYHADGRRPENLKVISQALSDYVVDTQVVWGDEERWDATLSRLEDAGCDGVIFILGQDEPRRAVADIAQRLRALGRLRT